MEKVLKTIKEIYPLPENSVDKLISLLIRKEFKKGHLLFKSESIENSIYFIEKGIARAFLFKGEKEVTFWFGFEGEMIMSYYNYISNKPGYENIELLEDSVLYKLNHHDLQNLFKTDIEFANWGRKLAEIELVRTEEFFISQQFQTALERYRSLLQSHPHIIQRVQLGHIASYLGVTQVTLSRIRAEIK